MRNIFLLMIFFCSSAGATNLNVQTTFAAALNDVSARDFPHAISKLSSLSKETQNPEHLFQLALAQFKSDESEAADKTIKALLEISPEHADAHYLLGLVNLTLIEEVSIFRKVSVAKRALNAWREVIRLDPNHLNARYAVISFLAVAPGIAGGDLDEAKIEQAILAEISQGYGELARAVILAAAKEQVEAELAYQSAARQLNQAGPHFALAQFYLQTEQYEKVIGEIEKYQQMEQQWWDADVTVTYLFLARSNLKLGKVDLAREQISLGLKNKPNKRITDLLNETLAEI